MDRFSSVAQSCVTLWPGGLQHTRLPCPSPTPRACSNSHPSSWWCYPTISFSVIPFSSCLQSIPASGSFLMSQFFALGGQNIGVSASASVLPMNIQDWSPSEWAGWISLQFKGLSRVFYNTTVQKHQFFSLIFLYSPTLTSIHRIIFRIIKVISRRKHKPYRQYNTKGKISLQFLTLEKSCSLFAYDR